MAAALEDIKSQKEWWKGKNHTTTEGVKTFFHCKYSKYCPVKIYVVVAANSINGEAVLYKTTKPHDHPIKHKVGVGEDVKQKIKDLFHVGITKPILVLRSIREAGLVEPTKKQLYNYLSQLKLQISGKSWLLANCLIYVLRSDYVWIWTYANLSIKMKS